jgi:hypothetical protein
MPKKYTNLSPFADWLVKLAEERDLTLSALAQEAGLSPGTLRYLVVEPRRKPTLETCLRLSAVSGRPVGELLAMGGQDSNQPIDPYHPDRIMIVNIFDDLPPVGRTALLNVAKAIKSIAPITGASEDASKEIP